MNPTPAPHTEPASDRQSDVLSLVAAPLAETQKRRRSNILKLPRVLRDKINTWLDDGLNYKEIQSRLAQSIDPPLPLPISEMCISRWKDGGYQDYLARQERLELLRLNREAAKDTVADGETTVLPEATLQIIASQYYQVLDTFSPAALQAKLADDPIKYTRFVNSFARLTREILLLKKHRTETVQAAIELERRDPNREFNKVERDGWLDRADDLFNFKSASRLAASNPAPARAEGPTAPNSDEAGLATSKSDGDGSSFPGSPGASIASQSQIKNQKSKISLDESPVRSAPEPSTASESVPPASQPEPPPVPKSSRRPASVASAKEAEKALVHESPRAPEPCAAPASPEPVSNALPAATNHEPLTADQSPIKNQKSKIENSPETCYDCAAPLPPLLPNGQRPLPTCRACGARLYPPGTKFDQCSYCQTLQPILADNQRPSTNCRQCRNVLPPVGQRFVTHCPACGIELPGLTPDGTRLSPRCCECHAPVPLLEPAAI